jgi:tetratricopeptide (TPR) repeat protein
VFERAQYDKSADLIRRGDYKAAASEFEKFKTQYTDSPALSYAIFMHGYALHQANYRINAIKIYNEVLDFFGDHIEDAAPALYFIGQAQMQNGEIAKALEAWQEMVDDEDYRKHPLAAGALRALADHYYPKDPAKAVGYWKQVVTDFEKSADTETRNARRNLMSHYIRNADYAGFEDALINYRNDGAKEPRFRRHIATEAWEVAWHGFAGHWGKYTALKPEIKQADMKAFYEWFWSQKPYFEQANDLFAIYDRCLSFQMYRWGTKEEIDRLIEECAAYLREREKTSPDSAQSGLARMVDLLREGRRFERARYINAMLKDRAVAAWKEYEILRQEGNHERGLQQLMDIEKQNFSADWSSRALWERANYLHALNRWEEAIKVYQLCNNPPRNLWQMQECYKRMGQLQKSLDTLTEIENMFPEDASRAAWYKASYYDEAGDAKQAVAQSRRILQVYPKAPESSNAHQLLEKYGISTGGGVISDQ